MVPLLKIKLAENEAATQTGCQVIHSGQRILIWQSDEILIDENCCTGCHEPSAILTMWSSAAQQLLDGLMMHWRSSSSKANIAAARMAGHNC
jgi:hypothetical protein